jgi:Alkylmercury lyase
VQGCTNNYASNVLTLLEAVWPGNSQFEHQKGNRWDKLATSLQVEHQSRDFENKLRLYIYRHFIGSGRSPSISEMAEGVAGSRKRVRAALNSLCRTHAFGVQENGELWRAAPFSAVPTAFPVQVGSLNYSANCIWDALGIPAMLAKKAQIGAACGCCNFAMTLHVQNGRLLETKGIIHIAVPARDWYKDIVFT